MTPADWERVTDAFGEVLASADKAEEILAREPEEVRREVRRLLATHEVLEAPMPQRRGEPYGSRQPGRVLAGRYRLEYLLGAGGSGEAWLSSDLAAGDRQVVVKVPHTWDWFRHDLKRRFLAESDALRRISHPSIVTLLDSGETEDGAPFLVMPYVDGQPLRSLLELGPLPARQAALICEALGSAIQAAHASGVVHRDLKPENVLVEMRGQEPRILLIDFGIALFGEMEQYSSTTTRFFGTTQYMAPEQLLGEPAAASDIYAFALLAYEMAAGKPLFVAASPAALYERQRKIGKSDFDPSIPAPLRSVLWGALRVDPRRRPRDAAEFGRHVAAALRNPPRWSRPSRRSVLAAMAGVPAAAWVAWTHRPVSEAEKRIDFQGAQSFRDLGWKTWGVIDLDLDEMDSRHERYNGNRLVSRSQGGYFYALSARAQQLALQRPWRLSALLRPVHGFVDLSVILKDFGVRFSVDLVAPDQGEPRLDALRVISPGIDAISRPIGPPKPGEFARLEIRYDPLRKEAAVWLRGEKVIDGYRGCSQYLGFPGVVVGVGQRQSEIGEAVVGDLHFEMG
ncbi:putative Calcium/calmodulin-dependent protein kinase [Candidatus Sulfopaludibacter sp. SbA4]|nr:putative Calcium/calmodulin-dependent protein kinase [Candidatus Sulfopaludibacter sp. SbA4]